MAQDKAFLHIFINGKQSFLDSSEIYDSVTGQPLAVYISGLVSDVAAMKASLANMASIKVVDDITARDALRLGIADVKQGSICWVQDATADASVTMGAAAYIAKVVNDNLTWVKIAEAESLDVVLNWANIQDKPSSSVANIDDAVNKKHVHSNFTDLDKLGNTGGDLTYDGVKIRDTIYWEDLKSKPSSTPAQIDNAVSYGHTHSNYNNVLENLTIDSVSTDLMFNNARLATVAYVLQLLNARQYSKVSATIATRDALTVAQDGIVTGTICYVKDASADSTVDLGGATYIAEVDASNVITWSKISEFESLDLVLNWSDIQNKPTSSVQNIDDAVNKRHEHSNKAILDGISQDSVSGNMVYNGHEIYETELEAENAYVLNTENVIGVWIDGKPIHRRTLTVTLSSATSGTIVDLASFNCESLVRIYGMVYQNGSAQSISTPTFNSGAIDDVVSVMKDASSTNLVWNSLKTQSSSNSLTVTIEYTKTTDSVVGPSPFDPVAVFENALL